MTMDEEAASRHRPLTTTFIYPFVPHYRTAVFEELCEMFGPNITILAGTTPPPNNNMTLTTSAAVAKKSKMLKNMWFGPFLWQRGLTAVLHDRSEVVVYFADVHYVSTWVSAVMVRLFTRKRVVFWTIGWHRSDASNVKRFLRLSFYRLSHRLMLYGSRALELGVEAGHPRSQMRVVGNSIAPVSGATGLEGGVEFINSLTTKFTVGGVVRPTKTKQLEELVNACALLRTRGVDIGILLVGEGPCKDDIETLALSRQVPICAPGPLYSASALANVYEVLDLTVVPANVGLTAIQSLQNGTPVITHDDLNDQMPEAEAVIDGLTGALYRRGSVDALADAIEMWLSFVRGPRAASVAAACVAEVSEKWNPLVSAERISRAVCDWGDESSEDGYR